MTEHDRLSALKDLQILDTPREQEYDDLVLLASTICAAPISLVSLVDEERQWFKASVGLDVQETHRDLSFCAHAIMQKDLFVVEDAAKDPRFIGNALVTGASHLRFYAGMPLQTPYGAAMGTLCVIDTVPRKLTPSQSQALKVLAAQVQTRMELRLKQKMLEAQKEKLKRSLQENKQLCISLRATNDLFLSFMSHGPFASFIKDADGSMIFYNKYLAELSGVTEQEWIGLKDHEIWPSEMAQKFRQDDLSVLEGGVTVERDDVSPSAEGGFVFWKSFKFPYRAENGTAKLAGISIDVTRDVMREAELENALREKSILASRLEVLASTDFLTGLLSRRVFADRAEIEFADWKRRGSSMSMLILDVDDFKRRNDAYGHQAGDLALKQIGNILNRCVRLGDIAARMGGEEFGVLLPHTDIKGAMDVAERFRRMLSEQDHGPCPLTVSIGVSSADHSSQSWELVLSQADAALYEAKRTGKNKTIAYASTTKNVIQINGIRKRQA